jgi:hypothetical protein
MSSTFLGGDTFSLFSGGSGGGTSGVVGSSGTSGLTYGTSGTSGSSGSSGSSATSGVSGSSGTSATSGFTGTAGTSGSSGSSGSSGVNATAGTSGLSSTSGTSGSSATSGFTGTAGTSGSSGSSGVSAAGVLKTYTIVLNTLNGILDSVVSATDPVGNNLIGAPGWSFTISSATNFIVGHPLGNVWVGAFTNGLNGSNVLTRTFSGNTTGNYSIFQNNIYTNITFYSLNATNAGYSSVGASTLTINVFAKV